jgi:hypothetical protein
VSTGWCRISDSQDVSKKQWPAPICLAEPLPGDFCCIPVSGQLGTGIEAGEFLAETLEGVRGAKLQAYDHAEVYVGQADRGGPHGYTYSAYPDNGKPGKTGRRPLPCPPAQLPGSIWSSGIIRLTAAQRSGIIGWCAAHPCVSYSWPDYGAIALRALGIKAGWLRDYIEGSGSLICSQFVDSAYNRGGNVHLYADGRWEGFVTPGDLAVLLQSKMPVAGA